MAITTPFDDEDLIAYLDAVLPAARRAELDDARRRDPVLAARLAALDVDTAAIRAAFDAQLPTAPTAALRRQLAVAASRPAPPARRRWPWLAIAASLLLGAALGQGVPALLHPAPDWRMAVADYQVLYTTATLNALGGDSAVLGKEVAAASAALGRPLTVAALQVDGLAFKRAQVLAFDGRALTQFAYLDAAGTPIAFCATRTGQADEGLRLTRLHGLAAASWSKDGYGFLVIGGQQAGPIQALGESLQRRI